MNPIFSQYFSHSLDVNSRLLLNLISYILWSLSSLTNALNFLKELNTLDFSFKKYTQLFLLKSSMKSKKNYFYQKSLDELDYMLRCVEPNHYPNSKSILSWGILGILHM